MRQTVQIDRDLPLALIVLVVWLEQPYPLDPSLVAVVVLLLRAARAR